MERCNGTVYYIQRGDTLYSISRRYNVPLAMILRANPFVDIYSLQIGDAICIPTRMPGPGGPGPVVPGPGGPRPGTPSPTENYRVRAGETIEDILDRFQISFNDLLRYNSLDNMYLLPGITLRIPRRSPRDDDERRDDGRRDDGRRDEDDRDDNRRD